MQKIREGQRGEGGGQRRRRHSMGKTEDGTSGVTKEREAKASIPVLSDSHLSKCWTRANRQRTLGFIVNRSNVRSESKRRSISSRLWLGEDDETAPTDESPGDTNDLCWSCRTDVVWVVGAAVVESGVANAGAKEWGGDGDRDDEAACDCCSNPIGTGRGFSTGTPWDEEDGGEERVRLLWIGVMAGVEGPPKEVDADVDELRADGEEKSEELEKEAFGKRDIKQR